MKKAQGTDRGVREEVQQAEGEEQKGGRTERGGTNAGADGEEQNRGGINE
jgi:hypothetical protein